MATNVSTIGAGQDYTTLALWESDTGYDLVSAGDIEEGHLVDDLTITADQFIGSATADASNYRVLRPDAGNEYDPVTGIGRSFSITSGATDGLVITLESFFKLRDLLLIGAQTAQTIYLTTDSDNALVERCFIRLTGDGNGIFIDGDTNVQVFNCIVDGDASHADARGFRVNAGTTTADLYNCVAYKLGQFGFQVNVATNIRNCAAVDSVNDVDFSISGGGTKSHNLSSDTSAPGTSAQTSKASADTFTDAANEDLTLKAGSAAIDNGVDLSGTFTDDILGGTRSGTWDIGAYQHPLEEIDVTLTSCTEGEWDDTITFDVCDDLWLTIDGAKAGADIKVSVTIELEEL